MPAEPAEPQVWPTPVCEGKITGPGGPNESSLPGSWSLPHRLDEKFSSAGESPGGAAAPPTSRETRWGDSPGEADSWTPAWRGVHLRGDPREIPGLSDETVSLSWRGPEEAAAPETRLWNQRKPLRSDYLWCSDELMAQRLVLSACNSRRSYSLFFDKWSFFEQTAQTGRTVSAVTEEVARCRKMNVITDLDKATYMPTLNMSTRNIVKVISVPITQNSMKCVYFVSQWNWTELSHCFITENFLSGAKCKANEAKWNSYSNSENKSYIL